jgi:methionyl-tRNA synthetase
MDDDKNQDPRPTPDAPETATADEPKLISIDDFARIDLRVAEIVEAERVEGADKLLRLQVRLGDDETRQLVAGIAKSYEPEQLVGRTIIVVANLKPAKIRGVASQGMLLAAGTPDGGAVVATFDEPIATGARVS